jgi:hypothetical protein
MREPCNRIVVYDRGHRESHGLEERVLGAPSPPARLVRELRQSGGATVTQGSLTTERSAGVKRRRPFRYPVSHLCGPWQRGDEADLLLPVAS